MTLSREIRQTLVALELVSHGATQSWNSSGRGESTAVMPPGELRPPHLYWAEMFARTPEDKHPALLTQARIELDAWRKRTAPLPTGSVSLEDLILEDGAGWEPEAVARKFGVSTPFVCRIRSRNGRSMEDGRAAQPERTLTRLQRRERVRELKAQGMTLRQIASLLDVDHKTVSADLKAA